MINRLIRTIRADVWQSALSAMLTLVLVQAIISEAQHVVSAALLLLGLSTIAVAARLRYPEAALLLQLLITISIAFVADDALVLHWGLTTASLLSLASIRERRTVMVSSVSVLTVLYATAAITDPAGWRHALTSLSNLGLVAWTLASAGVGSAVRSQRQYIRAVEDEAVRAEERRELEAQRRITEERLRIARELHDAVAHQMAVVSMFTGLARTTLTTAPDQAEQALAQAQTATRSVLSELQQILRILREPGTEAGGAIPATIEDPVHSVDDIDALVRSFEELGLRVRLSVTGEQHSLSSATGLAAYRVVQEALTNAHKYGNGTVEVSIAYHSTLLVLDIRNPIGRVHRKETDAPTSTGFGLIGMRERVRMLGGTLAHGSDGEAFHVTAELPLGERVGHAVGRRTE